ncbi:hypothetical protein V5J35_000589 [Endozoicomonas sp. NE40]|uniref:Uncharacterized protein n=1 Tax=Endozoicomonas lisbonensis TaxID=3120522 RepID=A0ABV2SCB2_9GAMM
MRHEDLPERWKQKIKSYLQSKGVSDRDELWCEDFEADKVARVTFEDEST